MTDWADEQVKAVRENMPLSIKEFDEAFSAVLRKAKADGMREAAAMVYDVTTPQCALILHQTILARASRVEQPR